MFRSLFRLIAALSLVFLMPAFPHAALSTGLQYDEIVRVVVGGTPPPPGNFQADAAALASPAAVAATAPPHKHHGFNIGAIAGGVLSGNIGGAITGGATDAVVGNAIDAQTDRILAASAGAFAGALRGLTQGRLERHSFYGGWERVDDVAGQTATIRKCDLHQFIKLDLAKKTYSIEDPTARSSEPSEPAPKAHDREPDQTPAPAQPGTAVVDFSNVVTPLPPRKLEGLDTTGYDDTATLSMTQATGSCKNGTFAVRSRSYYSRLATPRLVCPIAAMPPQRYPQPDQPQAVVAQGGCRPTFTAHKSGPLPPAGNLSLYSTVAMSAGSGGPAAAAAPGPPGSPGGFLFLTERGNVHSLGTANANLFAIPSDFTKVP
jgi:hypothetical protein